MTPAEFERRAAAALGGRGWQVRWGLAAGISRQHVSKVVNGRARMPPTWPVILELLEAVEAGSRPARWPARGHVPAGAEVGERAP